MLLMETCDYDKMRPSLSVCLSVCLSFSLSLSLSLSFSLSLSLAHAHVFASGVWDARASEVQLTRAEAAARQSSMTEQLLTMHKVE